MTLSVLMFCPQFRPLVGGAERQAEKLAKTLVQRGLRVAVLTPRLVRDSPEHEEDEGVIIHRFPLFDLCKRFPWLRGFGPLNLLLMQYQTGRALRKHLNDADVVHMHIATAITAFAMQVARKREIPVLCKVAMTGERTDLGELSDIGLGGSYLAKGMIRYLDRWVATTQAVRESLLTWGVKSTHIATIPNGVDLNCPSALPRNCGVARRFLYLGRLSSNAQRDIPTLIHAFDKLADQIPDVELALVGDGDLFQETATVVAQTHNKQRIQMPGQQKPELWLQWADCLILPSRQEGLSNALLEAMTYGLVCIANDIPSNREVLADGTAGVLVPIGGTNCLHMEMRRVAVDPGLLEELGDAALRRVREHYSIEAVSYQYIHLYKQLMDQGEA